MSFKTDLQSNVKKSQEDQKSALDFNTNKAVQFYKKIISALSKKGFTSKTFSNLVKIKGNSYTLQSSEDDGFDVKDISLVIKELEKEGLEVKLIPSVPYTKLYINWE